MTSPDPQNVFATGRPGRSIRWTHLSVFAGLIVLIFLVLGLSIRRNSLERDLAEIQVQRHQGFLIAEELRWNSHELTRMARTYAQTGNPAYEQFFNAIIAIRDGRAPRPANYDKVYWDLVVALGHQPSETGPAESLDSRIEAAHFTKAEQARLEEVRNQSGGLLLLQRIALNAVKGIYRDANGRFALRGAPNAQYANRLLHGPEFHQAEARMMKPLRDFQLMLDHRTSAGIIRLERSSIHNAWLETGLVLAAVLLLFISYVVVNRRIIEPILQLTASAVAVGRNGFFRRVLVERNDELGTLAGALNRMSETVEQQISEADAGEERFRELMEASPDALIITDEDGKITRFNHRTERLLGYSGEEMTGQPLDLFVPITARAGDAQHPGEVTEAGHLGRLVGGTELSLRCKDGSELFVEVRVSPITASDGSRWTCTAIHDLAERSATQAAVDRQLGFQAAVLDVIPLPIFIKDTQARYVACNRAYEEAFGVSRESLAGKTVMDLDFIPKETREAFHEEQIEVIRTASRRSYELPIVYQDATGHVTIYTVDGFRLADGTPAGLIGFLLDITDCRRAEKEADDLRRLFQAIIDNANAFVYVKDTLGRYLFVNFNYANLVGKSAGSLIGRTAGELFGRDAAELYEEGDREVRQTRELREREEQAVIDGRTHYFVARRFPLVNAGGELFGTAGVFTEISETRRMCEELAAARAAVGAVPPAQMESPIEDELPDDEGELHRQPDQDHSELSGSDAGFESLEEAGEPRDLQERPNGPVVPNDVSDTEPSAVVGSAWETIAVQLGYDTAGEPDLPEAAPEPDDDFPVTNEKGSPAEPPETVNGPVSEDFEHEKPVSSESPNPVTVESPPAKPDRKKRSPRKKKKATGAQTDLFGGYDESKDEAGPVQVTLDPDGVPIVPGLDFRDAMSRLGLPLEEIKGLIIRFADGLTPTFAKLRNALETQDHEAVRKQAGSIADEAGNLSADALRRLAKTFELGVKFEQGDTAKMLADLELEAARMAEGIRQLKVLEDSQPKNETIPNERLSLNLRKLQTILEELATALDDGEFEAIVQAVGELKEQTLPERIQLQYERLSELVDGFDYVEAAEVVRLMQNEIA